MRKDTTDVRGIAAVRCRNENLQFANGGQLIRSSPPRARIHSHAMTARGTLNDEAFWTEVTGGWNVPLTGLNRLNEVIGS
jgi:hypothetical protein